MYLLVKPKFRPIEHMKYNGEKTMVSNLLFKVYGINNGRIKSLVKKIIYRIEGGELYSKTLRKIFKEYWEVDIGMYTIGGCFNIWQFDRKTTIGRYCSIAHTAFAINRNHPMNFKSTHPFFYNPTLKFSKKELVEDIPLKIGNDVWLGHNSIIMPNVREIGNGAVIAAGAVVNKNVPPYAIVVGNPSRVVRYRFSKETIEKLLEEKWWEKSIEEIKIKFSEYLEPYEKEDNIY